MKKNLKWIGLVLMSCGVLVGCGEESSGDEKLTDDYVEATFDELNEEHTVAMPEDIKNGTVSEDVYLEAARYLTEFVDYEKDMLSYQDKLNKNSSLWQDDSFLNDYKESMDSYEIFIKGVHVSPLTEKDIEINNNLTDTLIYTENIISSLRQYIATENPAHVKSTEETMNKRNTSHAALTNTIKNIK